MSGQLADGYDHVALVHHGTEELLARLVPDVDDAVARGHAVLVSLRAEVASRLLAAVAEPDAVTVVAADARYDRPGVAMAAVHRFASEAIAAGAPLAWSIGAIPFDGTGRDRRWVRYEQAVDDVLGHLPLRAVCPYDVSSPPSPFVEAACSAHRTLAGDAPWRPASSPIGAERPTSAPPDPPAVVTEVDSTGAVRRMLARVCGPAFSPDRVGELQLAGTELIANAMMHGSGRVTLRVWLLATEVVLEVSDGGSGIADRYADLRPHQGGADGGFGLWLVGQLAEQVDIDHRGGCTVVTARFVGDRG
jgi:anti-sigma regulatory factor (Ser/Thr protein kinase)